MDDHARISDEELIQQARADKEALGLLIERYESSLLRYIRRLGVRDEDDMVDILQNTFIKVYRNLNEFDTSLRFSSWIYRIAHNETMSWFRKRHVRPEGHLVDNSDDVLELMEGSEWNGEEHISSVENSAVLADAIASLEEKYREVVVLRFFEHKEYDEISDILQIPIGSVGTLLHRAKRKIRDSIDTKRLNV